MLLLVSSGAFAQTPRGGVRALPTRLAGEWKGDFDGMLERRAIRMIVPYSRTLYFHDKGTERGVTADFARDFEHYVNKEYHNQLGKRPLTVLIRPAPRDLLLKELVGGFGDIAAGNLTATDERKKIVEFVAPADQKPVSELVLTGPKSEARKRGLNPNVWFDNVELVTAEKIGIETTTYVRNIYKYYVAYRLLLDVQQVQAQARGTMDK